MVKRRAITFAAIKEQNDTNDKNENRQHNLSIRKFRQAAGIVEVLGVGRIGKRIVLEFERELSLVFHLMVAKHCRRKDKLVVRCGSVVER